MLRICKSFNNNFELKVKFFIINSQHKCLSGRVRERERGTVEAPHWITNTQTNIANDQHRCLT